MKLKELSDDGGRESFPCSSFLKGINQHTVFILNIRIPHLLVLKFKMLLPVDLSKTSGLVANSIEPDKTSQTQLNRWNNCWMTHNRA